MNASRMVLLAGGAIALMIAAGSTAAPVEPGATVSSPRESRSASGSSHGPTWSPDGQWIGFVSLARNLSSNSVSGRYLQAYARDLRRGQTILLSVGADGLTPANDHSFRPLLSSNGAVVAFESAASNLDGADTNGLVDIFVRDLAQGTTRLVTRSFEQSGAANGRSRLAQISEDGRFVLFESNASNLVPDDANGTNDVFLHDRITGTTTLISTSADRPTSASGPSGSPAMAADGAVVAFVSKGTNLVPGVTNLQGEVYVRRVAAQTTLWAGVAHLTTSPVEAMNPMITRDGRFVAYRASPSAVARLDLSRPTNTVWEVFPAGDGAPDNGLFWAENPRYLALPAPLMGLPATLSDDGRFSFLALSASGDLRESVQRVDFESFDVRVEAHPGPTLGWVTNRVPSMELWVEGTGTTTVSNRPFLQLSAPAEGHALLLLSDLTGLHPASTNGSAQIFVQTERAGPLRLISSNRVAQAGVGLSAIEPVFSPDGRWIAYESPDPLVRDDWNGASDVHLREMETGDTTLVSEHAMNKPSAVFAGRSRVLPDGLSEDGRWLVLSVEDRQSPDLDPNPGYSVWLQDRVAGTNQLLEAEGSRFSRDAVVSADGTRVAFCSRIGSGFYVTVIDRGSGTRTNIATWIQQSVDREGRFPILALSRNGRYLACTDGFVLSSFSLFDLQERTKLTLEADGFTMPQLSRDNQWLAVSFAPSYGINGFTGPAGLHLWNLNANQSIALNVEVGYYRPTNTYAFSADSRFITFVRNGQVIRRALSSQEELIVTAPGRNPSLSGDGRYLVCETPPVENPTGPSQIVLFDLVSGTTNLLSRGLGNSRGSGGNGLSRQPSITSDGRFVVFTSRASDLVTGDTNGEWDVFVRDRVLGVTLLASANRHGTSSGNGASLNPVLAADGRTVMFQSLADDLVADDHNQRLDVYLLELGGADRDNDGLDDEWELAHFNSLGRDGSEDFDGDGWKDRDEFLGGTSPTTDQSILRVLTLSSLSGGPKRILWSAVPGRTYLLEFTTDLAEASWSPLAGTVTAAGETASLVDADAGGNRRFYRVRLLP